MQTGFITPRLLVNVPDVRLPMAFFQPSELVLSKCLKVTGGSSSSRQPPEPDCPHSPCRQPV